MYSLNTTASQSDFQDPGRPGTLSYTLEDVQSLKQSTWTATSSLDSLTGVISQTGGGPAEKWDQKAVFLTRFFGTYYPFITFTTTSKVKLDSLSFTHYHNHNPGFPSNPSYDVQLQISTVKEWKAIGSSFTASPQTHGKNTKIDLNGQALAPGAYTIRWIPVKAASNKSGFDTNTEFFAMEGISLTMVDSEGKTGKISYDIDDITKVGPVSTWIASSTVDSVTGVISQTGGGPAEKWDEKAVFLTRFLGKNYPFITVTATSKIQLNSLSFKHYHNHNVGYPSYPSYDVGLQLYTDDGWVDISSSFKANKETHGAETKIGLDGVVLGSGTHKIRWMPLNVKSGFDTNTEFFAMDEIRLEFTSFSYERDD